MAELVKVVHLASAPGVAGPDLGRRPVTACRVVLRWRPTEQK